MFMGASKLAPNDSSAMSKTPSIKKLITENLANAANDSRPNLALADTVEATKSSLGHSNKMTFKGWGIRSEFSKKKFNPMEASTKTAKVATKKRMDPIRPHPSDKPSVVNLLFKVKRSEGGPKYSKRSLQKGVINSGSTNSFVPAFPIDESPEPDGYARESYYDLSNKKKDEAPPSCRKTSGIFTNTLRKTLFSSGGAIRPKRPSASRFYTTMEEKSIRRTLTGTREDRVDLM
jgi:hypothetical protein